MTRRLLVLAGFTGLLLVGTTAATGPAAPAAAAMRPAAIVDRGEGASDGRLDARLGDGIFTLRIRSCGACRTAVTLEIDLSAFGLPGPG